MSTEEERFNTAFKVGCSYLLYERASATQLKAAFTALVQERHYEFHSKRKDDSSFMDCHNQICKAAKDILLAESEMKVEINHLSNSILDRYNIRVNQTAKQVTIFLEEKNIIQEAKPDSLIAKL